MSGQRDETAVQQATANSKEKMPMAATAPPILCRPKDTRVVFTL